MMKLNKREKMRRIIRKYYPKLIKNVKKSSKRRTNIRRRRLNMMTRKQLMSLLLKKFKRGLKQFGTKRKQTS